MTKAAHIAIVDDEADLRAVVARYFLKQGYSVSEAAGGEELRALMARRPVDLVILDITMPGEDGLSIARWLRAQGRVGIVMLTANSETIDRVIGLEIGADDYVAKPFDLRELLARVRSVLRRAEQPGERTATLGSNVQVGRCTFDRDEGRLFGPSGREVALTAMEVQLLQIFVSRAGEVLTRDAILDLSSEPEAEPFSRSIDTRIARLRKKVEADPARPQAIRTVHGQGYVFVPGR